MSRIRREILAGIAALSTLGVANAARADDHRLKPEYTRGYAQDGRGETSDFRQGHIRVEQVGRAPDREHPMKPYTEKSATPLPIKSEVRAHFSENTDNVKMPTMSSGSATDDNRSQEQMKKDRAAVMAQLPMKTEISMRISDSREGEANPSTAPNAQSTDDQRLLSTTTDAAKMVAQRSFKASAALLQIPLKNDIKMRMHSGGDGQADEL